MEFVSFPSLKETGKGVFEYVRQDFSCKGKIYLYPITDTTGVAFCGEPSRSDLIIPVVIKRLLNKNFPFAFFFTVDQPEENKKLFGAVIYDGKTVEPYLVPYDSKAVKSVLYYSLRKRENAENLKFFYLGAEDFEHFLKSLIPVNVEFKRIKPKPVTDEELNHLIAEPSIVEFLKETADKVFVFLKSTSSFLKEKALPFVVIVSTGLAGYYSYDWFKHRKVHRAKLNSTVRKKHKPVSFLTVRRNLKAFEIIKTVVAGARNCTILYDFKTVTAKGNCTWKNVKSAQVVSYFKGKPVEVVYPVRVSVSNQKVKPVLWEKALKTLKITGTKDAFITELDSLDELKPLFETNQKFTAVITKTEGEYLVEVNRGVSKGKFLKRKRRRQ